MAGGIIYAAGNPDLYPIEYYDTETESYEGVIPDMLEEFGKSSGYDVSYYRADEGDLREELGQNLQVDIVSGCTEGEMMQGEDETGAVPMELFSVEGDDGTQVYELYVTEAAPEGLAEELADFAREYPAEKQLASVLTQDRGNADGSFFSAPVQTALTCFAAAALFIAVIFAAKYRKYRNRYEESRRQNEETGMLSEEDLAAWTDEHVTRINRVFYYLIHFKVDEGYIRRPGKLEKESEFYAHAASVIGEHVSEESAAAMTKDNGFILVYHSFSPEKALDLIALTEAKITAFFQTDFSMDSSLVHGGICPLGKTAGTFADWVELSLYGALAAEEAGKPYQICDEAFIRDIREQVSMTEEIYEALKSDEIELYLQLYSDTPDLKIAGGEALARWNHPERGLLGPAHFIPALEREGLIYVMDYYCLDKACSFLDEVADMGIEDFFVSCNFSRKTFAAEDFVERWQEIVDRHHFPLNMLVFELTESVEPKYRSRLRKNLIETKARGVRVFLDDFGDGFTSLYDLREYAVDGVKLDKTLTDNADTLRGRKIIESLVSLGHDLNVRIIAEGLERMEQVEVLKELGCDIVQGFCLHYPAPLWDVKRTLKKIHGEK